MNSVPIWVPLLGSLGTIAIALAAWTGLRLVQLRTLQVQERMYKKTIDDRFDELSVFFWTDPQIRIGRDLISYDTEYEKVRETLSHMTNAPDQPIPYDKEARDAIEAINCLCACLTRVDLLKSLTLTPDQEAQRKAIFGYWVGLIQSRDELRDYFARYWEAPVGEVKDRLPGGVETDQPSLPSGQRAVTAPAASPRSIG
jgi:hypothetical protein